MSSLVDRATTDLLIGPDWAMNLEICDTLNHDPGLAKDVVRRLKKRIRRNNPKIQLLALTLLETIVKNCGDMVHMHVAERDLPHQMVKIVKKKPDFNVKEKILVMIDTWQEAFGGPRSRYPQFYAAYQELLYAGTVFPKRPERATPILGSQKNSHSPYRHSPQRSDYQREAPETSAGSDLSTLSLEEILNARGIMDILSEMLNALDPGNKQGLKQEVILDLVHQCRSYKQRLVHLVNTTSDEDLLCQGLALNDDLQHVIAKYDALSAGVAVRMEKTKSLQVLVDIDDPVVTTSDGNTDQRSNKPMDPLTSRGTATPLAGPDSLIDLLSSDFDAPAAENSLALVPVGESLASAGETEQNALVLSDMFSQSVNTNDNNASTSPFNSLSETPTVQAHHSSPQPTVYSNGSIPNSGVPQFQQFAYSGTPLNNANPAWNGQFVQDMNLQQQSPGVNDQGLPPPPWEIQSVENSQVSNPQAEPMQNGLPGGMMHPEMMQSGQFGSPLPELMQGNQHLGMHPSVLQNGQMPGYPTGYHVYLQQKRQEHIYDQRPSYLAYSSPNGVSHGMYAFAIQDNNSYAANAGPSYQMPTTSYVPQFNKPAKPEDKLFGDLVNFAKVKQNKNGTNDAGKL